MDSVTPEIAFGVTASASGRRWIWRRGEERLSLGIAQQLGVPEIVGRLLTARGVGIDDAAHFLSPTLRALMPDPSVMQDMDEAAERLARAVIAGEKVAVFGDYDVDGGCAGALMASLLRGLGLDPITYVPDRIAEGYGPNPIAMRALADRGASLVICVDCGTSAHEALSVIHNRADIIVLDHHKADGPTPQILATVNPNRLEDTSGLRALCATGVAFLTAVATVRALRRAGFFANRAEPNLLHMLDLVALATVCDVMPLSGLNRALVAQGLKVIGSRARPGIAALLDVAQARETPTAFTCGFALGPRINAGGRISEPDLGMRLLLTEDEDEARALAATLDAVNRQRQQVEAGILDSAMLMAQGQSDEGNPVLLLAGPDWHPGVVGIVAGRVKEKFNRPTCVGALQDGLVKGSARSVPGLDLGTAIIAARQAGILLTGGGHAMAAGFSLRADRLAEFHSFMNERLAGASSLPSAADLAVEATVTVPGATTELAGEIGRLAPFGAGNEEPVIVLPRVRVIRADRIGKDGNSLRAFIEGEGGGARLKALCFRLGDGPLAQLLLARERIPLHLAGYLRAETWNGQTTASFFISDAAQV